MIDVPVKLGPRSYRILVGAGLLAQAGPEISRLGVGRKLALVTDPSIRALYGEVVAQSLAGAGFEVTTVLLPEGERAKTLEVAAQTWDRLLEAGLDRGSAVVALGGGAVGDLAGFVAATYMRGMHFVQLPTTLLAQVDASIGGKTAIDHPRAKNLIGAFHQPRLVLADTGALQTLPEREYRSGLAEVIKHGIVLDAAYFGEVERSAAALAKTPSGTPSRRSPAMRASPTARRCRSAWWRRRAWPSAWAWPPRRREPGKCGCSRRWVCPCARSGRRPSA